MMQERAICQISQKDLFVRPEEVERFFQSITPGELKYKVILLLICSGIRPGEAVRLNIADIIKPDCSQLYVSNTKVARDGKKPRRDLKVLSKNVAAELRRYIEQAYADNQVRNGYFFPTSCRLRRAHMSRDSFSVWFCRKRKQLGMTEVIDWKNAPSSMKNMHWEGCSTNSKMPQYRISPYSFRRFFATEMAMHGQDQRVIALLMGHLDTRITSQYQDRLRMLQLAPEAVEHMPKFFGEGQKKLGDFFEYKPIEPAIKPENCLHVPVNYVEPSAEIVRPQRGRPKAPVLHCSDCQEILKKTKMGSLYCEHCNTYQQPENNSAAFSPKAWREANKDKICEQKKAYYTATKDKNTEPEKCGVAS
jgi:site-specific recombinase XerD